MKVLIIGREKVSTLVLPFLDPGTLVAYNPDITVFLGRPDDKVKDWSAIVQELTKSQVYTEEYAILK